MSPSLHEESVFYAALQLADSDARADYLLGACGGDARLRQRVERLIAAHGAGEFLERPGGGLVATELLSTVSEQPGATIGPYKLLEQIGEGGMGLVFMAEQTRPLRRRVALKIIKPGLDTQAVIARFEAERQALALMEHANIARVFDAGTTDSGRPYFVMELVRGVPITDYCLAREVDLRGRLELFIQVCHAVQHAHQKGVIHRDLKPPNILVSQSDTAPIPKVIDFGVAKAITQSLTERTLFTHFAQIIGTPLYMSPEQADLGNQDVDTRSDVYSLGVVLYELLTGTTPFDAERLRSVTHDEMRRIIREEEPPKPSTRATTAAAALSTVAAAPPAKRTIDVSSLKGDLDWIVMKALEKDRRRRYASPGDLAADIQRHLADQPVEARPPSVAYRVTKFTRRNQRRLFGTLVVTLALVGLAVVLVSNQWTTAQRRQVIRQSAGEIRTAAEAGNFQLADRRFAEMQGLLKGSGFDEDDESIRTIDAVVRELNQRRTDQQRFEQFVRLASQAQEKMAYELSYGREKHAFEPLDLYGVRNDPQWLAGLDASYLDEKQRKEVRREAYFLLVSLATSTLDWKQYAQGVDYLRLAVSFHKPTRAYYSVLSRCYRGLGDAAAAAEAEQQFKKTPAEFAWDDVQSGFLAQSDGDNNEAIRAYEDALRNQPDHYVALMSLADRLSADANRLDEAVQLLTGCIALRSGSSAAYRLRAGVYHRLGNLEAAAADFDAAVRLAETPSDVSEARRARIRFRGERTGNQDDRRQIVASLKVDLDKTIAGLGPDHEETLNTMLLLASFQGQLEPTEASLKNLEQTLSRITGALGPDHDLTADAHREVAYFYEDTGRLAESAPHWEAGLGIKQKKFGTFEGETLFFIDGLGRAEQAAGKIDEALALFEGVLQDFEREQRDPYSWILNNAATVYRDAGRFDEAAKLFERALVKQHERDGSHSANTQNIAGGLLSCYSKTDDPAEMFPLLEEIFVAQATELGEDNKQVLVNANNRGWAYFLRGRIDDAMSLLEGALPRFEATLGPNDKDTIQCTLNLAGIYRSAGRHADAIALLEKRHSEVKSAVGAPSEAELRVARQLAACLATAQKFEEASALLEPYWLRAKAALDSDPDTTRSILIELARFYDVDKDHEALAEIERDLPQVETVLQLEQAVLGPDHEYTLSTKNSLAVMHYRMGRKADGVHLLEETVEAMRRALGIEHTTTAVAVINLADCYFEERRYVEAKALLEGLWDVWKAHSPRGKVELDNLQSTTGRLGDLYELTGDLEHATDFWRRFNDFSIELGREQNVAIAKLSNNLLKRARQATEKGAPADAELLLRELLTIREQTDPDNWKRYQAMSLLGEVLSAQSKYDEAEPLLVNGAEGMYKQQAEIPAEQRNTLREATERLVAFYEAAGRASEAQDWREKLVAGPSAK